jgi:ligand-binding SRPBCC domain-containing protein
MLTSYELDVAAPVDIVFAAAADVGAMPRFTRDVESMVFLTPAPLQQGSEVRDTRRLLGVRRSQVITIPLYDPPARFIATFAIFGVTFESDHLFFDEGGHTRFLVTVNVAGASGLGHLIRPFVPLVASIVRYGIRREIEDIKIEAERRATKN